jgi:uncharacterized DUF497 family protein
MDFEWDETKRETVLRQRGIDFRFWPFRCSMAVRS